MTRSTNRPAPAGCAALPTLTACAPDRGAASAGAVPPVAIPRLEAEPTWPLDLPPEWVLGPGTGLYVDGGDHVWALHRPERIVPEDMAAVHAARDATVPNCCAKAPPLIELDPTGHVL